MSTVRQMVDSPKDIQMADATTTNPQTLDYDPKALGSHDGAFEKQVEFMRNNTIDQRVIKYGILGVHRAAMAGIGYQAVRMFLATWLPNARVMAAANVEVDVSKIAEGASIVVTWRGKPVFIRHRTKKEIEDAKEADNMPLRDPSDDDQRVKKPEWLVCIGICTHLGCVPLTHQGNYGGYFCPCHGSHYDTSGRIREGPAPLNLPVPPYTWLDDTHIMLG